MSRRPTLFLLPVCLACAAWGADEGLPTGVTARVSRAGAGAVRIPPGEFVMGADLASLAYGRSLCRREAPLAIRLCLRDQHPDEEPCEGTLLDAERGAHTVWLGAYAIDRTEVTGMDYARCAAVGACHEAAVTPGAPLYGRAGQPVVGVSWDDAVAYCAWAGGRLPTEAEWERAARGVDGRPWPWGWQWDARRANHGGGVTTCRDASDGYEVSAPVGSYPDGASTEGVLDLAGNVMEWTADAWAPGSVAYSPARQLAPAGARHGADRMIRGGAWDTPAFTLRTTWRGHLAAGERALDVGFRCAWDTR